MWARRSRRIWLTGVPEPRVGRCFDKACPAVRARWPAPRYKRASTDLVRERRSARDDLEWKPPGLTSGGTSLTRGRLTSTAPMSTPMVRSGGAHSDGQVDAIMANVADDVVTFDVVDPLRRTESWRRSRTAAWLEAMTVPSA